MPRGRRQTAALSGPAFSVEWFSHSPACLEAAVPDHLDGAGSLEVLLKETEDVGVASLDDGHVPWTLHEAKRPCKAMPGWRSTGIL
jgi:hypothetical protein